MAIAGALLVASAAWLMVAALEYSSWIGIGLSLAGVQAILGVWLLIRGAR